MYGSKCSTSFVCVVLSSMPSRNNSRFDVGTWLDTSSRRRRDQKDRNLQPTRLRINCCIQFTPTNTHEGSLIHLSYISRRPIMHEVCRITRCMTFRMKPLIFYDSTLADYRVIIFDACSWRCELPKDPGVWRSGRRIQADTLKLRRSSVLNLNNGLQISKYGIPPAQACCQDPTSRLPKKATMGKLEPKTMTNALLTRY